MLINFIRLGLKNESKILAESLNGYLNSYKTHMASSIKAIDFYNNNLVNNKCGEKGCLI